jgi:hypothetical protein
MFDLAVAYRVYPGISKSPAYFQTEKLKLAEMCLRSFRGAIGGLRVKIWVLLDGCPVEYERVFRRALDACELEFVSLSGAGNAATFSLQVDILSKQNDAELVYFAEDDYFYFPYALEKLVSFIRHHGDVDFVSAYDHPDSYTTSSSLERHEVRPFGDRYWRTASSTCLTFLSSRRNLVRTQALFRTYCRGNMDYPIWLALTQKHELLNARVHWPNWFRMKTWLATLRWGYRELLIGKKYRLWVPIPTLATHMESSCLSPLIEWGKVFDKFENEVVPSGETGFHSPKRA